MTRHLISGISFSGRFVSCECGWMFRAHLFGPNEVAQDEMHSAFQAHRKEQGIAPGRGEWARSGEGWRTLHRKPKKVTKGRGVR